MLRSLHKSANMALQSISDSIRVSSMSKEMKSCCHRLRLFCSAVKTPPCLPVQAWQQINRPHALRHELCGEVRAEVWCVVPPAFSERHRLRHATVRSYRNPAFLYAVATHPSQISSLKARTCSQLLLSKASKVATSMKCVLSISTTSPSICLMKRRQGCWVGLQTDAPTALLSLLPFTQTTSLISERRC